jgi:hypothetical protein
MGRVVSRVAERSCQCHHHALSLLSVTTETTSSSPNLRTAFLTTVFGVVAAFSVACAYPNTTDLEQRQPSPELLMQACSAEGREDGADHENDTTDVINWSGTHKVTVSNKNYWEPESVQDVERIIKECHERGQPVRPIGSSLSPNGIAMNAAGMISMASVDRVLEVDTKNLTVTVEAGITVSKVAHFDGHFCCNDCFKVNFRTLTSSEPSVLVDDRLSMRCDPTI